MSSQTHPAEPHVGTINAKLNWLRAGVLGANDGIVSVAGIVIGVAAATTERGPILAAGVAGLAAGALSIAVTLQPASSRRMVSVPSPNPTSAAVPGPAPAASIAAQPRMNSGRGSRPSV